MNAVAEYERVLFAPFAPRASAPWIRGRELGLHHQFHLILTISVRKTQKMRENGETYTAGKSFTLDRMDIFANKFAQSSTTYS